MSNNVMIIGIAGGTGSGKSTFTNRLRDAFPDDVAVLYHDNYYKCQDENLNGLKLLVIQPINLIDLHPVGEPIIAADIIGAGVGETVIYVGGSSARPAAGGSNIPVDATIVGIVDGHDVDVALI